MTSPIAEAKTIVDDLMKRGVNGELEKIGIGEIRDAIAKSTTAQSQGLSAGAFEEIVTRELIRRI